MDVSVIGLGVMGGEICRHIAAAGFATHVHDHDVAAVRRAESHGANAVETPLAAGERAELVVLSLPGPAEVTNVITAPGGVLDAVNPPRWILDLSTNSLETVTTLARRCRDNDVTFYDAPVSGGRPKAITGELSLMIGADDEIPDAVLSVLRSFTERIFVTGRVGTATVTKLANNQLFLTACAALQESYLMASVAGVDLDVLHSVLRSSSAAPIAALAPFLMRRNFDDVGFRLDIAAKDLALSTELATSIGVDTPTSRGAAELYRRAVADGFGGLDFHGLIRSLESISNHETPELSRTRS